MMKSKPFSWSCAAFLNGQYDRLFGLYREESRIDALLEALDRKESLRAALKHCVRLVGGSAARPEWVELRPQTQRQGVVLASNVFLPGAVVRSRIPWSHAVRPRETGSARTTLDPRWLRVIDPAASPSPKAPSGRSDARSTEGHASSQDSPSPSAF